MKFLKMMTAFFAIINAAIAAMAKNIENIAQWRSLRDAATVLVIVTVMCFLALTCCQIARLKRLRQEAMSF